MRLSKIAIKNFRGIRDAEIKFEPDITVLVGENNSGKTSILEALRLCLDAVKSDKFCNFSEFDFYRDKSRTDPASCDPISITVSFLESEENPWPEHIMQVLSEVIVGNDYSAIKLRVTAKFNKETGELVQNLSFLDDEDEELIGRSGMTKKLRQLRPFFYLTALRAAKDQFQGQSTYWTSFLKNKDIDEATQKDLEQELNRVNQEIVDKHTSFKDIIEEIKRISDLIAEGETDVVSVDPTPANIYNTIRYSYVNLLTASAAKLPVHRHGEGMQSLSVLLLFSAYLKSRIQEDIDRNAEPIIAIEEPEAHLHPNAVRGVWSLLEQLPGQQILATHSGDILSEVPVAKLRRISRIRNSVQCRFVPDKLLTGKEKIRFNHHVRRNRGELLFARYWLLVEGETDVAVFLECANLLGAGLHQDGIRVIEYAQAGGPDVFIPIADALGIQWHLVADNDRAGQGYAKKARVLLNDRPEDNFISLLPYQNIDILLCCRGYGKPYRDGVIPCKEAELTGLETNSRDYWGKVYSLVKDSISKPVAATEALEIMSEKGKFGVPCEIRQILEKVRSANGRQS